MNNIRYALAGKYLTRPINVSEILTYTLSTRSLLNTRSVGVSKRHESGNNDLELLDSNIKKKENFNFGYQKTDKYKNNISGIDIRQKILALALKNVKKDGWTQIALQNAAVDFSLSPSAAAVVEDGPTDLALYFVEESNSETLRKLHDLDDSDEDFKSWNLKEKVLFAMKTRIIMSSQYIDSYPGAIKLLAHPKTKPKSFNMMLSFVNQVLKICGEKSFDFSWYAKRASLVSLYLFSELYMITDFSPKFKDTIKILDDGISKIIGDKDFI